MNLMKKIAITISSLDWHWLTVDSIKIEQTGDLIKIRYKILNSTPDQFYKVTVLCSINGGLQSVLKSLSGDYGDNVVGGRSEYMVLWDVLKDVDEVKSVDFSVRAELLNSKPTGQQPVKEKVVDKNKVYLILATGGVPESRLGLRIGYSGSWGISAMFLKGKGGAVINKVISESTYVSTFLSSIDITKRVVNKKNFKLHLYTGIAASKLIVNKPANNILEYTTIGGMEGGIILGISRLAISGGLSTFKWDRGNGSVINGQRHFGSIGLGMRF